MRHSVQTAVRTAGLVGTIICRSFRTKPPIEKLTMDIRFDGKTALVTGAGKGIGRTIAAALYKCGATTIALSRKRADLDSLKTEYPGMQTVTHDLTDWKTTKEALEKLGHIDLLVNNAGVIISRPFLDTTENDIDTLFQTNFKAVFNVSQVVARGMVERGTGGAIVNISGLTSMKALRNLSVLGSSKAAVDSLTRTMALELGPHKIRVNSVNPTLVGDTNRGDDQTLSATVTPSRIPLGRYPEMQDVTDAVLFLLSDRASMINGISLPVDGGRLIG